MSPDQKFMALKAIAAPVDGAQLLMRSPGNWYCRLRGVEIGNGNILRSETSSSPTPEAAIEAAFEAHTNLKPTEFIVLRAACENRREVRWNGFMWEDIDHSRRPTPKRSEDE